MKQCKIEERRQQEEERRTEAGRNRVKTAKERKLEWQRLRRGDKDTRIYELKEEQEQCRTEPMEGTGQPTNLLIEQQQQAMKE